MSTKVSDSFHYSQCTTANRLNLKILFVKCTHQTPFPTIFPRLCFCTLLHPSSITISKKDWSIRSNVDSSRLNSPSENNISGSARLVRVIKDLQIKLVSRIREMKNGFPMKVLLFLVGFYCATAFSTVIGQTGDWDVLSAGLAVIVVEGIGALMYKTSFPLLNKIRGLITMFNFWKAGLTMGLFLDAFKYEIDYIFGFPNPFNIEFDVLSMLL